MIDVTLLEIMRGIVWTGGYIQSSAILSSIPTAPVLWMDAGTAWSLGFGVGSPMRVRHNRSG